MSLNLIEGCLYVFILKIIFELEWIKHEIVDECTIGKDCPIVFIGICGWKEKSFGSMYWILYYLSSSISYIGVVFLLVLLVSVENIS